MAEDLNIVTLVGRLTRDAELTYTRNETPLLKFSLAVNRRRREGESWVDEANFFDLVYWGGRRAEALQRYLQKGQQVAITGQLQQDRWEQDGQRRSRVLVEVSNLQLLGGRSDSGPEGRPEEASGRFTPPIPPPAKSGPRSSYEKTRSVEPSPDFGRKVPSEPPDRPQQDDKPIRDFEDDVPF